MSKEYMQALEDLFGLVAFQGSFEKAQKYFDIIEEALQRLESIDNANPSEALKCLDKLAKQIELDEDTDYWEIRNAHKTVENALLKAQEQEKENELLKEIIKSLFDRGCPLHQYIDKDFGLTIEVDDECSILHLGEYKGINLDEKLKEVFDIQELTEEEFSLLKAVVE